jgi:hypothetical protein
MSQPDYPVIQIDPNWVLQQEALGSKEKFWFRRKDAEPQWLFKFPDENTGQHWAEKIAAEVAEILDIPHAHVELAVFQDTLGSATESFARDGWELFHGNQILAGKVLGYDPDKKFQQSDHTLTNIFTAIDKTFLTPETSHIARRQFAEFLVLDALIGNTDRHHENWGILRRRVGDGWEGMLAPTFDHASSLGRELLDANEGKCRERLLRESRVGEYAEKGRGGVYWEVTDERGLSPLELVRRAATLHREPFKSALSPLRFANRQLVQALFDPVPAAWMTPLQREFAIEFMCYNYKELQKIRS